MSYPNVGELTEPLLPEELEILRKQYMNEGKHPSQRTRFNLAWGLMKGSTREEQREGMSLLAELYRDSPERRREVLYYMALGSYKLGDYGNARRYTDTLLQYEPRNPQINQLRQAIEDKLSREGVVGIAIVGSVLAVGAAALTAVLRRRR